MAIKYSNVFVTFREKFMFLILVAIGSIAVIVITYMLPLARNNTHIAVRFLHSYLEGKTTKNHLTCNPGFHQDRPIITLMASHLVDVFLQDICNIVKHYNQ